LLTVLEAPDMKDAAFGYLGHNIASLLRKRFEQRAKRLGLAPAQWQVIISYRKR
jgi:hypothetical protein